MLQTHARMGGRVLIIGLSTCVNVRKDLVEGTAKKVGVIVLEKNLYYAINENTKKCEFSSG